MGKVISNYLPIYWAPALCWALFRNPPTLRSAILTVCYKSQVDFYSEQYQKDFRNKCMVLNYFMKVFVLWLEYYWTWVIKKISTLLKFHLCKSLKFLAFVCIKIESKLFRVVFKVLLWQNLSLFLAYDQLSLWGALSLPCPSQLCAPHSFAFSQAPSSAETARCRHLHSGACPWSPDGLKGSLP